MLTTSMLKVRNLDINCEEHPKGFGVKWDGKEALLIPPAESRVVPDWLGRHYAKKLTEHLMLKDPEYLSHKLTENAARWDSLMAEIIEEELAGDKPTVETIPKGHGHVVDPLEN